MRRDPRVVRPLTRPGVVGTPRTHMIFSASSRLWPVRTDPPIRSAIRTLTGRRCDAGGEPITRRWPGRPTRRYSAPCRGAWRPAPEHRLTGRALAGAMVRSHRGGLVRGWCRRAGARCREAGGFGRADENRLAHRVISRSGTTWRLACPLIARLWLLAPRHSSAESFALLLKNASTVPPPRGRQLSFCASGPPRQVRGPRRGRQL